MKKPQLYSIGHSSRSIDTLTRILTSHGIVKLADVRRFPGSRRHPQFSREPLCRELSASGIEYTHLGEKLGGFREATYEEYVETDAFLDGLRELEVVAQKAATVFMCAEKNPWHCHRRFIAQALIKRGWKVIHILDENTLWNPEQPLLSQPNNY